MTITDQQYKPSQTTRGMSLADAARTLADVATDPNVPLTIDTAAELLSTWISTPGLTRASLGLDGATA